MKPFLTFLIVNLILIATPTFAGDKFSDQVAGCVYESVAYARYATMAAMASDSDHAAFMAFIQQIADKNDSPEAHALILSLGEQAWRSRRQKTAQADAMDIFTKCYSELGLKI